MRSHSKKKCYNCFQCNSLVNKILDLDCNHDLCFDCASRNIVNSISYKKKLNQIQCKFCDNFTIVEKELY